MKKPQLTIGNSILSMPERDPSRIAVKYKENHQWIEKTWQEYYKDIEAIAAGLIFLGAKAGERIVIMSNTRYEWSVSDYAILGIKAVTVPIYQNNTAEDVEYIVNDSQATFLISENKATIKTWNEIKDKCPSIKKVFTFESTTGLDSSIMSWHELMALGKQHLQSEPDCYKEICKTLSPDDMSTLIYTSGTTGRPKGVVLTHTQIISEVSEAFPLCGANPDDVSLSFLPYAHVLGRIEHWGHMYIGFTMGYAESIERIRHNMGEIKPTILVSVPRIFEKVYSAIWAQMETQKLKLKLFNWALDVGKKVGEYKVTRQAIPLDLLAQYEIAKKLVLNKISDAFGGRLRFAISGGAPISKEIVQFFHAANVLILEGYGLTETTAAITVNTPFNYKFGSVGRPIGDVQIKIAEDGEILVKSNKVMREYYNRPKDTKEVFTDGWFHTGDIGEFTDSGDLKITDRKKDLIKTAGGKYVAPQKIEGLLKLQPIIAHALIHGDQKKYIVAIVTLEKTVLEQIAKENGIAYTDWTELVDNQVVSDLVRQAIADTNTHLASYESIKKYLVLPTEFTIENGDLTPSLKVKRKHLDKKYQEQIESLYH